MNNNQGQLFDDELSNEIRDKFYHVDVDPINETKRMFFDNAGGALRLKAANDKLKKIDELPDCQEHSNQTARWLKNIHSDGIQAARIILNAEAGSILTSLTASKLMFDMVRSIIRNVPGDNVVTTELEHPSVFDSVVTFAKETNKEVRVAKTNSKTGGVDVNEIINLVDENTCLLNVIYASNITGSVLDVETITKRSREIKPDLFIAVDAVQHVPHGIIDLKKTPVDAINFAPYKFCGPRGFGVGYMSERASILNHDKLRAAPKDAWELGVPPTGHFAALSELVDYICWIGTNFIDSNDKRKLYVEGMKRINLHERALMYHALNGIENIDGARAFPENNDLSSRDFILPIIFNNLSHKEAVKKYEEKNIIVFERLETSPFSGRILRSFDLDGVIRVSPLHCHNLNDIKKFLKATNEIV